MADWYVDSNATGSPTDGLTWDTAFHTLAEAAAVDAAGDNIWVASDHSESTASGVTLNWAGTVASPTRVISADKTSGEPPSTTQTGAVAAVTGDINSFIMCNSGVVYFYGIEFQKETSAVSQTGSLNLVGVSVSATYEDCNFVINSTNSANIINPGSSNTGECRLINCGFKFGHASQFVSCHSDSTAIDISGGSVLSGGTSPGSFINNVDQKSRIKIEGFDFSNASSSINIVAASNDSTVVTVRNCKLPASWSGSLNAFTADTRTRAELHNSDGGDTNYVLNIDDWCGTIVHETTLVKSSGASDGTTAISWEMTTNANAEWSHQTLDSPEIGKWQATVGSPVTITVDILFEGEQVGSPDGLLTDQEVWLEVQYQGTSGYPLSLFTDDAAATYTTTAASQATSAASWTTTGLSNPVTQKLSVTFTPQEQGWMIGKVRLARASTTIYVDPVLQVS